MLITDLLKAFEIMQKETPAGTTDMTLPAATAFLYISQNEGILTQELAKRLNINSGTNSNLVHTLADGRKRDGVRRPGFQLVRQEQNPEDYRIKNVFLTAKGKKLLAELEKI